MSAARPATVFEAKTKPLTFAKSLFNSFTGTRPVQVHDSSKSDAGATGMETTVADWNVDAGPDQRTQAQNH